MTMQQPQEQTPIPADPRDSDQVDLRDYLRVMVKRRWTIITVFAVIFVTVAIATYTATPIYKGTTRLVIEKENPKVVSIEEVMAVDSSGTDYYQTQYKIIESRSVARAVIRRLNLEKSEEFFPKPKDDLLSNLKRSLGETIDSWKVSVSSLFQTGEGKGAAGSVADAHDPDSRLVSAFIDRIEVSPIRNSRLVDIGFEARDPVLAAKIVNTLASAYIDQNLEIKLRAVQDAVSWLHQRIEEERNKVEKAEQALLRYKERHGIITDFSSDTEQVTAQKLAQLNQQVVEAESRRVEAETRYNQALALKGSPDMLDSIPEVLKNELIRELKTMEVNLYKRMSEFSEKYGEKHPKMMAVESELAAVRKRKATEVERVINSLKNEYRVAQAKENSLKAALAGQKSESLDLNQKAIQYSVLRREADSARNMYELLVKRFKETTLTEDMRTGNIRVVDRAEVPKAPVKPRKNLNLLLALIVGLAAGTGLAFFFEYLDNTIKVPDDVRQYLNIPYLGPAPVFAPDGKKGGGDDRVAELAVLHSPKSTASEAYRGIRTNLLFSSPDRTPQVMLITSAGPREGKTVTTANLAVAMAQGGSRVVVIDCDLRRPKIHKMFGFRKDMGITNLLVGSDGLDQVVIHTDIPNLDVIASGPLSPNPAEMLGAVRMTELMAQLRARYDRILIDSPPITAVTDASVLCRQADGVILVIRAGETAREMIRNGVHQLQTVGAHILGAVLNAVDIGRDKYYYYYYYQYYYYYYGDDGEKRKQSRKQRRKRKSESAYYGQEVGGQESEVRGQKSEVST